VENSEEQNMQTVTTIGLDIAKSVFQVHGIDAEGKARTQGARSNGSAYVKPYVKRQKNDVADAEAICEAVRRPTMRFVATKAPEQAELPDAPSHAPSLHPPADLGDQCDPRPSCRVRAFELQRRGYAARGRVLPGSSASFWTDMAAAIADADVPIAEVSM
jgi:hypothetical protein